MNQLAAMREVVKLMDDGIRHIAEAGDASGDEKMHLMRMRLIDPSLTPEHVHEMLETMESGVNPQDTEKDFSDGKMGRWLGWAQCTVVALGLASLEQMKEINRRHAGK